MRSKMFQYIILGLLVVIAISLIYWVVWRNSDSKKRKKSEDALRESAGTFDAGARRALDELTRIDNPTADDYFRRGHIIQYNVLEGNIQRRRGENRAARRERRNAVGHIVRDYTDALLAMRGRATEIGADREMDPEFMIYHIEDFNRALIGDEDDAIVQMLMGLDNVVTTHAPAVRQEIAEERRDRATATANTRAEAVALALDDATKFTDDRQNVHDSKVNNDLRLTLRKLKSTAPYDFDPMESIDDAAEYIATTYSRDPLNHQKTANATRILEQIRKGETISTFGETEDNIFGYTWERCNHPRNKKNSGLMREAIITALADGIEHGAPVCPNGRCGRVLNSLVILDFDQEVASGAMSFEAWRNRIFQESKTIVEREIERAKNSNDDDMRAVGEAFDIGDESPNPEVENQFKANLKKEIDNQVDSYSDKLNDAERQNIKNEIYVYSTI